MSGGRLILVLLATLLVGCGGSGSKPADDPLPDGSIRVVVTTTIRDENDAVVINTRAERVVSRNSSAILAGLHACLEETYPQLTREFYGHELQVQGSLISAGYSPLIVISGAGMANPQWFTERTTELLATPGFVPETSTRVLLNCDTFSS